MGNLSERIEDYDGTPLLDEDWVFIAARGGDEGHDLCIETSSQGGDYTYALLQRGVLSDLANAGSHDNVYRLIETIGADGLKLALKELDRDGRDLGWACSRALTAEEKERASFSYQMGKMTQEDPLCITDCTDVEELGDSSERKEYSCGLAAHIGEKGHEEPLKTS